MAAVDRRRWTLTGPGAVSSHAARGQPPPSARNAQASLSWRRHGGPEPSALPVTLPCLRTAGPRRPSGPGWTGVTRAVGRALEGEMHGSPPHPAGSERDEPVPGMISGGAPAPQAPPEMHDPALAAMHHLAPGPWPGQTGP